MFSTTQYANLVGITIEGDKLKVDVYRLEKDALTGWRWYVSQNNNNFTILDWDTFKKKIDSTFKDIDKELRLRKRLKKI